MSESDCPFCGHTLSEAEKSKVIPSAAQRMGRNAMFVFATTVALGACSPAPQPAGDSGSPDAQADAGGIIAMYGAPAPDAQAQPDAAGPNDDGGNMALYGSPVPVDASPDSALNDGGGVAPLYGGPVPNEDAGSDGNPGLRYGAPPPTQDV